MAGFSFSDFFNGILGRGGAYRKELAYSQNSRFDSSIISKGSPISIDWNNLLSVYRMCPPLQMVLTKKAEMLSNGQLKIRTKSKQEDILSHWALDLMKNPNPLQSRREYIYEWSLYNDIYANNFIYCNRPFPTSNPKSMLNLPSGWMQINPTGKWLDQTSLEGIIDSYELRNYAGISDRKFTTNEVKHTNNGISFNWLKSDSKLVALQPSVSNIIGALRTRGLLINENAGTSIISSGSKDSMGTIKMSDEERKKVVQDFKESHGLRDDQMRKIITSSSLTVTPVVFPVAQMMLVEEVEEGLGHICGTYGVDRDIFPSTKGATFENKKAGEISTYTGVIQTTADSLCNFLDMLLLNNENDLEFYMDYSHLYCMREDQLNAGRTTFYEAQAMQILFQNGIIDAETFAEYCEVEYTGDGIVKSLTPPIQEPTPPTK